MCQFGISGETESFGTNNLMGQWLKAIGYGVEQIGINSGPPGKGTC